jgi:hypothetical protein
VTPKFPEVSVKLIGENGNTGAIMGRVTDAMKRAGVSSQDQMDFRLAVMDCDSFDAVIRLVAATVTVEGMGDE